MNKNIRQGATPIASKLAFLLLEEAAAASGQSSATLLAEAGIPFSLEDLTSDRASHLPKSYFAALASRCINAFELQASRYSDYPPMSIDDFKMLCYCFINCTTLQDCINRAAAFCAMLGGRAGRLSLTVVGDSAQFTMTTFRGRPTSSALISDMVGLTAYHRLFSWLCGEYISIDKMGTTYDAQINQEAFDQLFTYPIEFNQQENYFSFSAKFLKRKNVRSYTELEELLTLFPFDLLSDDWLSISIESRIKNIVQSCLLKQQPLPTANEIALQFNISSATLRRRLTDANTSLTGIKDQCRQHLAKELISHTALSFEAISSHLCYSDTRVFRRAFKQWTGLSPSQFRRVNRPNSAVV